jgi:hypothetical protein
MSLTREEQDYLQDQEDALRDAKFNAQNSEINMAQQSIAMQEQDRSTIKDQLDLSEELDTIEQLLRGRVLKDDGSGNRVWTDAVDKDMVILSEYGIYLIMNTLMFYVQKNTLLSNYDEDTINKKMMDFSNDLADTIFMEYEKVFNKPTFEECKEVLMGRIDDRVNLREFALELTGKKPDKQKLKEGFIKEIENTIDLEIQMIKEQIMKNKLKRFLIIMREIQDVVHSTYLRAYAGQERKTLRQHIHISENINPRPSPPTNKKLNPLNWNS